LETPKALPHKGFPSVIVCTVQMNTDGTHQLAYHSLVV
jgi:hypothetical protein